MKFIIQSHYYPLVLSCFLIVQAKIVYLNGTEIVEDNLKIVNVSTTQTPPQKWFSVFNPRNISNHSGDKANAFNRKNDEEEQQDATALEEAETDHLFNGTLSTRDTTVLSSLRGIWSDLTPILTIISTILGIFLIFVIIESPLSPLPVPPLPYPPIGPYPPTNIYPFGVPPRHHYGHYGVRYAGPPAHGSYRIPRNLEIGNETETMESILTKVIDSIIPNSLEETLASKNSTWAEQLFYGIKSFFINFGTTIENESSRLLEEIASSNKKTVI